MKKYKWKSQCSFPKNHLIDGIYIRALCGVSPCNGWETEDTNKPYCKKCIKIWTKHYWIEENRQVGGVHAYDGINLFPKGSH